MTTIHRQDEIATLGETISYLGMGDTADDAAVGQLQTLKRSAEAAVRRYLGYNVTRATYTHYLPRGNPFDARSSGRLISAGGASVRRAWLGPDLVLPQCPLRSITSIYEDTGARFGQTSGAFAAASLLTEGTHYYWPIDAVGFSRLGTVRRIDAYWPSDPGSIKVTYVAGWTSHELHGDTDESEKDATQIRLAVLKTMAEYWGDKKQAESGADGTPGPIKAESLADYSVTYDTTGYGPTVELPPDVKIMLRSYRRLPNVKAST